MTDVSVIPNTQPQRPVSSAKERAASRITPRVRAAIEAMVWQGLQRKAAAEHAGLAEHSLYQALRRPPVRSLYLSELEVLRTSERARNIHTLAEVRDQTSNQMARVQAVKALEQIDDDPVRQGVNRSSPGFVIQVITVSGNGATRPPGPQVIDNAAPWQSTQDSNPE